MNARIERPHRPLQPVDAQRRRDIGNARELLSPAEREPQQRDRRLCAIDQREALLRREPRGLEPGAGERSRPGLARMAVPRLALADEHEREVRQRREIAACPNRSSRRHHRMHTTIEQRDEQLQCERVDAGKALREHVGAERHHRPHDGNRQRPAHAGRVAAQQVDLQRRQRVGLDLHLGKGAEAGIDAIDRRIAASDLVDNVARRLHTVQGRRGDRDLGAVDSNCEELVEREGVAVENNHDDASGRRGGEARSKNS